MRDDKAREMVTDLEGRYQRRLQELGDAVRFYVMPERPFTPVESITVKKVIYALLEHLDLELEIRPSTKPEIVLNKKESVVNLVQEESND